MARVVFDQVSKRFAGGVTALKAFDLAIEDGELLVLVGPSGCGKSTALRLLAGLEEVSAGEICIDGQVVNQQTPQQRNIAMVFQNYALYPHMSVRGNLEFPLKMAHLESARIEHKVEEIAGLLDLTQLLDRLPKQLSGGQRQRVAMGRALVRDPSVFLLDEPLSNLDAKLRAQIRADIAALQRHLNKTTLYVTHDQVEAMTLGDRVAVMNKGELQQVGTPESLYRRPRNLFVAGFIGSPGMNILPADLLENELSEELGKVAWIGFRPEAILVKKHGECMALEGSIDAVEYLGHESLIHFHLGQDPNAPPLIARLGGQWHGQEKMPQTFYLPLDALYGFDREGVALAR